MKTILTGVILICASLVCYIGEGFVGRIVFFIAIAFSSLGLLPLLLIDYGLVDFFIGWTIHTTVVKFSLGLWTCVVVPCYIGIVYL